MDKNFWVITTLYFFVFCIYFYLSKSEIIGDVFIYPLDDAYIHLAIAKNLALNGNWSINSFGFDSASSSVLYTLLLSFCIRFFGDWQYYPLLINCAFGYLTVIWVCKYFKTFFGNQELWLGVSLVFAFSILHVMVFFGMEHTMHMFLMVVFIFYLQKYLNEGFCKNDFYKILILIGCISLVRFESMFLTVSLMLSLFFIKKLKEGFLILITGLLPIVIFGLISIKNEGLFFPNSVMVKGNYPNDSNILESAWRILEKGILLNFSFYKFLSIPLLLLGFHLFTKYRGNLLGIKKEVVINTIVLMSILHSIFAILEYRYENYVLISWVLILCPIIVDTYRKFSSKQRDFFVYIQTCAAIGVLVFCIYRFFFTNYLLRWASADIQEQQIEMSRFLKLNYEGKKVIANDIGAISYFSNVQLFDIVGLGSTDMAKFIYENRHLSKEQQNKKYTEYIEKYTQNNGYEVAVVYPEWFPNSQVPKSWTPVASWSLKRQRVSAAKVRVVFYAVSKNNIEKLKTTLVQFNLHPKVKFQLYHNL